jgi:hypothetical protein
MRLDNLDPNDSTFCHNPSIACQYGNLDNDSSNITEVILFEKYDTVNHQNNGVGYYNLQAATSSNFEKFSFTNPLHNNAQPDICFNTYTSDFLVTYYDYTDQELPFLTNNVNLANPNTWNVISQGYNDNSDLGNPSPIIRLNIAQQEGMNVWSAKGTYGHGVAMFDAPYSTYTGTSKINGDDGTKLLGAYPNPCNSDVTIGFELQKTEKVTILLNSIAGQPLGILTDQIYSPGQHQRKTDVSRFPQGIYIYTFQAGEFVTSGKVTVIR